MSDLPEWVAAVGRDAPPVHLRVEPPEGVRMTLGTRLAGSRFSRLLVRIVSRWLVADAVHVVHRDTLEKIAARARELEAESCTLVWQDGRETRLW